MDDGSLTDLMSGIEALKDSRHAYDKAGAYYDGTVPEVFRSTRLRNALAAHDIDFRLNFAKTPVNAVANRLKITAITSPDPAQSDALAKMWKDNQLGIEAPDLHRRVCEYGDGYLFVLPVEDDKGNTAGVEMYYNSPQTVRAIYREDRPREIDFVIKRWKERRCLRAELLYGDHAERWTTQPDSRGDQPGDWSHWLTPDPDGGAPDPDSWSIPNSWDWNRAPVFHFRTARPYGVPEHIGAYGPQNAITKLTTTHMDTVDYVGAPQRYALTETANTDTSDLEPGDFDDFPADNATTYGPTDSGDDSSLKADPGGLWLLRGYKGVGQFDAADPSAFLDPADWYVRALAQITGTPAHLFDVTGDAPSGESLRRKDSPLTEKVKDRQALLGATWVEASSFALRLLGFEAPSVTVHWAPASTVDDLQGWQTIKAKIDAGVPRKQALMEAGYTADQVDVWFTGADDAELQRRVTILEMFADAAEKMGAAAALQVLDRDKVAALLSETLADVEVLAGVQDDA